MSKYSYFDGSEKEQESVRRRFGKYATGGDPEECWAWRGPTANGYGRLSMGDKTLGAHRLAYELRHGSARGMHVLHRCDNRACVNPAHLFLGTNADNMRDKMAKGRGGHVGPKLTAAQRRIIRARLQAGEAQNALAQEFGVRPEAVRYLADPTPRRRYGR